MSQRLIVADLKLPSARIAEAVNVEPSDPRFLAWLNQAEEMMANQGRFFGSTVEVQFCIDYTGCFTLPREVASLERIAVNGQNVEVQNGWFPFTRMLGNVPQCGGCTGSTTSNTGCTSSNCSCGHLQMTQKEGTVASYNRTRGADKRLRAYPTDVGDVGKHITFQGYDSDNIWVKTEVDGVLVDGERLTLAFPFATTATEWAPGSPLAVVKDVTLRRVLVYEYDTGTGAEVGVGDYWPGETNPSYRVGYLPGLGTAELSGCTTGNAGTRTLTALARLWHVELVSDGDWLLLQNRTAYKQAMVAVKAYEEGDVAKGDYYFYGTQASSRNARGVTRVVNRMGAVPLLNAELRTNSSDRVNAFVLADVTNKAVYQMQGFI